MLGTSNVDFGDMLTIAATVLVVLLAYLTWMGSQMFRLAQLVARLETKVESQNDVIKGQGEQLQRMTENQGELIKALSRLFGTDHDGHGDAQRIAAWPHQGRHPHE